MALKERVNPICRTEAHKATGAAKIRDMLKSSREERNSWDCKVQESEHPVSHNVCAEDKKNKRMLMCE